MNQTTQGSKPIIIGIAGGTGAGKSTLINSIKLKALSRMRSPF